MKRGHDALVVITALPAVCTARAVQALDFAEAHRFEQTFARRVGHIGALAKRGLSSAKKRRR